MLKRQQVRRTKQAGTLLAAAFVGAAGLTLFAQAPAPANPQPPTPPAQGARGGGAAPGAPGGPGRGAGPANVGADWAEVEPIQPKRPDEQARTFLLPTGYRMEAVMSDPDIIMPVDMEWDGNGRLYVVEMRTYMLDADGRDKYAPVSRISRWESTKGDGVYDKHTVFVDNLVLPRFALPLDDNSILTNETETHDVVKWTDTNGDGVADKRELWYTGVGRPGANLEHQQAGFLWGLDNWIYSTYNAFRFRWTPTGIVREPTGPNGGQWGLTQDDDGKMWFVNAGGERGPVNFQVPIQYGAFAVDDEVEPGFRVVWPAPSIGDMQGGMNRIRQPLNNLNHFTATTGGVIVQAHRVPEALKGALLFTEPVGRLIRQAEIVKDQGLTQLRNAYPGSEFLLGTDPLFRPVNIKNGPDGLLYIADMYQGIIQESQWTPRGSYLRAKIEQYQLDKINQYGRVWRLRYDGYPAGGVNAAGMPTTPASPAIAPDWTQPRMLDESPAELVRHFTHPNGWWRNTAQRILVLKQDKSVVPALQTLARSSDNLLARFHALWTLEGLGALDAALVREALKDPNPRMRIQAMRASETLYKAGDRSFEVDYREALKDSDADMVIQAMLTLNVLRVPGAITEIRPVVQASTFRGVKEIGGQLIQRAEAAVGRAGAGLAPAAAASIERGETVYTELCYSCHGEDGRGARLEGAPVGVTRAPSLEGNERVVGHRDHIIKVLLHGMTGPIDGQTYTEVMIPMGQNTDQWIADVASFVRNSWGNSASVVTAEEVARVRAATANRESMWTAPELAASVPALVAPKPEWAVTASHNAELASRVVATGQGGQAWNSGAPQAPGMFIQIGLDAPVRLTEVQIDTPAAGGGRGGRGGFGGRGGAPGAAPPAPPAPGFARGYQVQVSMDGNRWTTVATGEGAEGTQVIALKQPTQARFVRVNQTATTPDAPVWQIQRVRLYEVPAGR